MPTSSYSCNLAANKLITFIMLEVSKRLLHIYDTLHLRQFTTLPLADSATNAIEIP